MVGFCAAPLDGPSFDCRDPWWVVALGWGMYLIGYSAIVVMAVKVVWEQMDYSLIDKLKSSVSNDRNWGPRDPVLYQNWLQVKEVHASDFDHCSNFYSIAWVLKPDEKVSMIKHQRSGNDSYR